jgi:hypothetical protein
MNEINAGKFHGFLSIVKTSTAYIYIFFSTWCLSNAMHCNLIHTLQ